MKVPACTDLGQQLEKKRSRKKKENEMRKWRNGKIAQGGRGRNRF